MARVDGSSVRQFGSRQIGSRATHSRIFRLPTCRLPNYSLTTFSLVRRCVRAASDWNVRMNARTRG